MNDHTTHPTKSSILEFLIAQKVAEPKGDVDARLAQLLGLPPCIRQVITESYNDSPFSKDISNMEVLKKFGYPSMNSYDDTINLENHIIQFKQRMFSAVPPVYLRKGYLCKGFMFTLSEQRSNGLSACPT